MPDTALVPEEVANLAKYEPPRIAVLSEEEVLRAFQMTASQIGAAAEEELERIEREVTQLIDEAVAFAEASPPPQPEDALLDVFWEEN